MSRNFGIPNPEAPLDGLHDHWTEEPPSNGKWWALFLATVGILIFLLWFASSAFSHDTHHPELNNWFRGLQNQNGYPCCDGSDATRLEDNEWEKVCAEGECHYRVMIEKKWYDVSDIAVVRGTNRSGVAQVWPVPTYEPAPGGGGNVINGYKIRCFMPGVEG